MDKTERLYKALEHAKFGEDLLDYKFQMVMPDPYPWDKFNGINLSSLFSILIREAGRLCDSYASDMFYDLKLLHEDLYGENSVLFTQDTYRTAIGIRDCGVDGESFMSSQVDGSDTFTYRYREIFLINITPDKDWKGFRRMSLYKVSPSSVDFYFRHYEEVE